MLFLPISGENGKKEEAYDASNPDGLRTLKPIKGQLPFALLSLISCYLFIPTKVTYLCTSVQKPTGEYVNSKLKTDITNKRPKLQLLRNREGINIFYCPPIGGKIGSIIT